MAQKEIYEKLLEIRKKGDDSFYSSCEIYQMFNGTILRRSIDLSLHGLSKSRHIEYNHEQIIICLLNGERLKKKYRAIICK